jgi:hypothetical protein
VSIASTRIRRSTERLGALTAEISEWTAGDPLKLQLDMSADREGWRLVVDEVRVPPPTDSWAVALGEVVHHVRSGLNNVVYQVAKDCSSGNLRNSRAIQFPISADEASFNKSVRVQLGEAHDDLVELVRAFQPFGSGPDFLQPGPGLLGQQPFALLAQFSNSDKHTEWVAMPAVASLAELGDAAGPVEIQFDRPVEDRDLGPVELVGDSIEIGATVLRQHCGVPIRRLQLRGRVALTAAVQTTAGPVNALTLAQSWVFLGGLVMLRMEDVQAPIDVIYARLESLLR